MLRRKFMKSIMGISAVAVVSPSVSAGCPQDTNFADRGKNYGTWLYRSLHNPHGTKSYWHPVLKSSGYHGDTVPKNWVKFSDEMTTPEEWCKFIRRYWSVRKVIESSEVVEDSEVEKMNLQSLLHTLYRVSQCLRYHGVSEHLIHSAVKPPKYLGLT